LFPDFWDILQWENAKSLMFHKAAILWYWGLFGPVNMRKVETKIVVK
jgi:hypothetical protein